MHSSYRLALRVLLALALIPASLAFAVKKDNPDKGEEALEPTWNPTPGNQPFADVAEQEPLNSNCPGQPFNCGDILRPAAISPAADNDYINFTANAGDVITFGTDSDPTGGTPTDTFIHLYKGAACLAADQVASDDDSGPGAASLLSYCVPAGQGGTYTGRIRHFSSTGTGPYRAFVTCAPSVLVGGETCATAAALGCGPVQLTGSTACYTNDYSPCTASGATCCTGFTAAGKDAVFSVSLNAGVHINLTYTTSADGSIYLLGLPVGSTGCVNPTLTQCVKGADATLSGQPEVLDYTTTVSGTYYLILDSFGAGTGTGTSGTWTLVGSLDCPVAAQAAPWTQVKVMYR